MKRFFSWLRQAWVWSLLGLVLLSLILWWQAPLLAFDGRAPFASETVRWLGIASLFLLWGAWQLWRMLALQRMQVALMLGLTAPVALTPEAAAVAAELATLRQRLQEALALMKSRGGVYRLPWYMFVGVPGAGKTTALVQSGLTFPLADSSSHNALGGVAGTRHCEWWFTDQAVLLDTAGRYTSQDSDRAGDQAGWNGFLQLLRKYRRRRPLNGVIVALSVADILQQTEAERQAQAQLIRARIAELHTGLGSRFPIYVMLTKCDLLPGFVEFFDHLGRAERAQVWGMTFALAEAGPADAALAAFHGEFQLLEQRLQAHVLNRAQQERDPRRRALVCNFPQQFAALGTLLEDFLQQVFAASRYEEKPLLRGVYFTSGTQEGSPIDRVMGAMADAFGLARQVLPPNVAAGRSYFITKLLREVIFPEANLARAEISLARRRRWQEWGGLVLVATLFALFSAALLSRYYHDVQEVKEIQQQVAALQLGMAALPTPVPQEQLLPVLNEVRDLPGGYAERHQSLSWSLGLSQRAKLGAGAQMAYQALLQETLLPRIVHAMEQQLRRESANNDDYLYETLRVYLMLGASRHAEHGAVQAWLDDDWARNLPDSRVARAWSEHGAALLEQLGEATERPQLNAALISATRLTLARMPLQQRIYNKLKRDLSRAKLAEFSVSSAAGRDAPQVLVRRSGEPLTRGINGMFSVAGYQRFLLQERQAMLDVAQDSWILAQQEAVSTPASEEQIRAALSQLYFNDYIKEWDLFLADVAIAPFSTLEQGARLSAILSGPESPLRQLLQAAAKQTTLEGTLLSQLPRSVGAAVKDRLDSYQKRLAQAITVNPPELPAPALPAPALNPVDAHFDDLHKLAGGAGSLPLDAVLAQLKDVASYLDTAAAAKRSGAPLPPASAMTKLKRDADGKPAPLGPMLQAVDGSVLGLTSGSERERLNTLWVGGAGAFCRAAIAERYPLLRSAVKQVTSDDFGTFFAPGGMMDDFFQKNLVLYVDMGSRQWHWRSTAQNIPLGMSQNVLDNFQRAAAIRDAFFSAGGKQMSLRFELRPLSIDPGLSKLVLDIDGQQLTYLPHTPARGMAFQVPSGKGNGRVSFEATPASPGSELHTDGTWAWFRMIDKGRLDASAQNERYTLAFDLDGKKAVFELNASSVINPFQRTVLEQFRCPASL